MNIKSIRTKEELSDVLMDKKSKGPEISYWVFEHISDGKWNNLTILAPGKYGSEFNKTYGHYHISHQEVELSRLLSGEGIFMLQKQFFDTSGKWIPEQVEEVYLVEAKKSGEVVYVPKNFAHSWSNTGKMPLLLLDDWQETGEPTHTYKEIDELRGMAYYLIETSNGQIKPVPNSNYINQPEPRWVTPEEFNYLSQN